MQFFNKKTLLTAVLSVAISGIVSAMPARPTSFEMPTENGSKINVTLHGDEYGRYYLTEDGYALLPNEEGYLCYVTDEKGTLSVSEIVAHNVAERTIKEKTVLNTISKESVLNVLKADLNKVIGQGRNKMKRSLTKAVGNLTDYPTIGSPNALVLLVEYQDVKFSSANPYQAFNNLVNQEGYNYNGATGSVSDYFKENSNGMFTPNFKVCGPVTLPNAMAYYGNGSSSMNPDAVPWEMLIDGCKILDETTDINFAEYDNDGDGFVDNVFIFYAGYGENDGGPAAAVWPHAANIWTYYNIDLTLDGVKLGGYACANELVKGTGTVMTGIGSFCHEYSHVLGLPDLYSTNGDPVLTPGAYELMDLGPYNNNGNTPPYMSAFDRTSVKWLNPRELTGPENVILNDIATNEALIINTEKAEEYYLFENRQLKGWDAYIPGHGMLVWHIDYNEDVWTSNVVNNNYFHQYVDIIEADGIATKVSQDGDPFPGRNNVTEFTETSSPAMSTWTGIPINKPITEIREQDGIITFKVLGGGEKIESVVALDATDVTPISFVANWEGRVGVYNFEVDVCRAGEVVPFVTLECGNVTSQLIDNLDPATSYFYVVRAVDGELKSADSNRIDVTTLDATFDMLSVEALAATEIFSDSFVANWTALESAESYELSVYTKEISTSKHSVVDFTDGVSALPAGWTTNCNATSGMAGYYGVARPSLRMTGDGSQITSPVFDSNIDYITFWVRGNSVPATNSVIVDLMDGETVISQVEISPINNDEGVVTEVSADFESVNANCVRIKYASTDNTSIYIDDIDVAYGSSYKPIYISGYDHLNVGNVLMKRVEGLSSNSTYYYNVVAVKGDEKSAESNEITVTTNASGGVEGVSANALTNIYTNGNQVYVTCGDTDTVIYIYNVSGVAVKQFSMSAYESAIVNMPHSGVYVVRAGDSVKKVVVK